MCTRSQEAWVHACTGLAHPILARTHVHRWQTSIALSIAHSSTATSSSSQIIRSLLPSGSGLVAAPPHHPPLCQPSTWVTGHLSDGCPMIPVFPNLLCGQQRQHPPAQVRWGGAAAVLRRGSTRWRADTVWVAKRRQPPGFSFLSVKVLLKMDSRVLLS